MARKRPEKTVLKPDQVCSIIETCAKSNVTTLKFGELELTFANAQESALSQALLGEAPPEEKLNQIESVALVKDELERKDDEAEQMLIENPALYEDLLEQGEWDADGKSEDRESKTQQAQSS